MEAREPAIESEQPSDDLSAVVRDAVSGAIAGLRSERHAEVLARRLNGGMTLAEVGDQLGVSRERVRQLEDKAFLRLRPLLRRDPSDPLTGRLQEALRPTDSGFGERVGSLADAVGWPTSVGSKAIKILLAPRPMSSGRLSPDASESRAQPRPRSPAVEDGTGQTLSEAAGAAFDGIQIDGRLQRFEERGWFHVSLESRSCPECGTTLERFRCPRVTPSGRRSHWVALVCPACPHVWTLGELKTRPKSRVLRDSTQNP